MSGRRARIQAKPNVIKSVLSKPISSHQHAKVHEDIASLKSPSVENQNPPPAPGTPTPSINVSNSSLPSLPAVKSPGPVILPPSTEPIVSIQSAEETVENATAIAPPPPQAPPPEAMPNSQKLFSVQNAVQCDESSSSTPHLTAILNSPSKLHAHHRMKFAPNLPSPAVKAVERGLPSDGTRDGACSPAPAGGRATPSSQAKRYKYTGKEKIDKASFAMRDLIYFNPQNDSRNDLKRAPGRPSKRVTEDLDDTPKLMGRSAVKKSEEKLNGDIAAPQIRIGADGNIIIDEESLTIKRGKSETELNQMETVEEDAGPLGMKNRKISSVSFRKRLITRTKVWTPEETDRFYAILSATGTDFGLMAEFFPRRSRQELKNKFRREERLNPQRVEAAQKRIVPLDPSLYEMTSEKPGRQNKKRLKMESQLEQKSTVLASCQDTHQLIEAAMLDDTLSDVSSSSDEEEERTAVTQIDGQWDTAEVSGMQLDPMASDLAADGAQKTLLTAMFERPSKSGRQRKLKTPKEPENQPDLNAVKRQKLASELLKSVKGGGPKKMDASNFPGFISSITGGATKPEPQSKASTVSDSSAPVASTSTALIGQAISLDNQMNQSALGMPVLGTLETEGGGKLVLLHEKSKVAGQPDMVHVYMLGEQEESVASSSTSHVAAKSLLVEDVNVSTADSDRATLGPGAAEECSAPPEAQHEITLSTQHAPLRKRMVSAHEIQAHKLHARAGSSAHALTSHSAEGILRTSSASTHQVVAHGANDSDAVHQAVSVETSTAHDLAHNPHVDNDEEDDLVVDVT